MFYFLLWIFRAAVLVKAIVATNFKIDPEKMLGSENDDARAFSVGAVLRRCFLT